MIAPPGHPVPRPAPGGPAAWNRRRAGHPAGPADAGPGAAARPSAYGAMNDLMKARLSGVSIR
jgi:hypothetical protein